VFPERRVVHRLTGVAIPHDGGFALVGDTEAGDVVLAGARRCDGLLEDLLTPRPDLLRVVLDPTGLGIDLLVLLLGYGLDPALVVEDHRPRARGALVEGNCVLRHPLSPFSA